MHSFNELAQYCTEYMLGTLEETQKKILLELETSGATSLVKALQVVQLQKVISAVGVFSMFDAMLQDRLHSEDGFRAADEMLVRDGKVELRQQFRDLRDAINVLKHGRGRSYDALVKRAEDLRFTIKLPDQAFFDEGDISEIATLVEVDDAFVRSCAGVIRDVTAVIDASRRERLHGDK